MRIAIATLSCLILGAAGFGAAGTLADRGIEEAEPDSISARRVWTGQSDFVSVSRDGRYMSDIDWVSGDFKLVDLQTGEAKSVTGIGYEQGRYAWESAFSNDGRIAVSWYVYEVGAHELKIMNLDGSDSRLLLPALGTRTYVDPVAWTSDRDRILLVTGRDRAFQLGFVSVDDGSLTVVKSLRWRYPTAALSPDDRWVAYDYPPSDERTTRDIYALASDGSAEITLVSGPANDELIGWVPEGGAILFESDRGGTPGLWRQRVEDGRAVGDPELIRADVFGFNGINFTDEGLAYVVPIAPPQIHTAGVDAIGRVVVPPSSADDHPARRSFTTDWSPDGRRLAFVVRDQTRDAFDRLVIRAVGGEVTREIPFPIDFRGQGGTTAWFDDETIYVFGSDNGGRAIYEVKLTDGSFTRVERQLEGENLRWYEMAPNGEIYTWMRMDDEPAPGLTVGAIIARRFGGEPRVVARAAGPTATLAVSRDGTEVAAVDVDRDTGVSELKVWPTSGSGEPRVIHRSTEEIGAPVAFQADGSRVFFRGEDEAIWSVAADGSGGLTRLGLQPNGPDLRISPDGRRIAFPLGSDRAELWMLKGY